MDVCTGPFEFPVPVVCHGNAYASPIPAEWARVMVVPAIPSQARRVHVSQGIWVSPLDAGFCNGVVSRSGLVGLRRGWISDYRMRRSSLLHLLFIVWSMCSGGADGSAV
jgi:hypothetical protein